ncbi:MAG: TetR/AcrR family transcriptional regulator [bacterium]|nr:TetR/AcrR family transcriptional regulator [bacterium]
MKENPLEKLKDLEREARKNLIMDAAERLFAEKLFNKVSAREIAKEAGISTGTIYTYFRDLESLFVETSLRGAHKLEELFKAALENENISIEQVAADYLKYIMQHIEYLRMLQHSVLYGTFKSKDSVEKLKSIERSIFNLFDLLFKKFVDYDDKKIRLLSHLFFTSLNGILLMYVNFPGRSDEQVFNHMRKLGALLSELIMGSQGR